MKQQQHVWIIEFLSWNGWVPVEMTRARKDARREMPMMVKGFKYQVHKYVREEKP